MARRLLIAGNWKMHKTLPEARELISGLREQVDETEHVDRVDVLFFPPATLLFPMAKAIAGSDIAMGAQNVHFEPKGAFTGELSPAHVRDTGSTHVLIGHSERRHVFGEQNEQLAKKVRAGIAEGLTVVYCVGELLEAREAGQTQSVVAEQLDTVLATDVSPESLVIAYEPVWAIGTGKTATPDQAQEVHAFIRGRLGEIYGQERQSTIQILYGGSVKPGNARELMGQPDIDGVLVGGACLVAQDFADIIRAGIAAGR